MAAEGEDEGRIKPDCTLWVITAISAVAVRPAAGQELHYWDSDICYYRSVEYVGDNICHNNQRYKETERC